MRADKVVPIRSAILSEIWAAELPPETTFEDLRSVCRALDLVPYVDGFKIGLTLARFNQSPPRPEQIAEALWGMEPL